MAFIPELKKDFKRLIDQVRLSHAYLIFGDDGDGCYDLARSIAAYVETGKFEYEEKVLIDAFFIDKASGIDDARSIANFLWQKPVGSPRRTIVLKGADLMTIHAEQAILKIVEQPPEHALIIITAKTPEALIPSLASRFAKVFLSAELTERKYSTEVIKLANQILRAPTQREATETIKIIIEDDAIMSDVVECVIGILAKNKQAHWLEIRSLLKRWTLISQFNVNKRLQLEAALGKAL